MVLRGCCAAVAVACAALAGCDVSEPVRFGFVDAGVPDDSGVPPDGGPSVDAGTVSNMSWQPAATYRMGCEPSALQPVCANEEQPVHEVSIDGFWIDTREVTVEVFRDRLERGCPLPTLADCIARLGNRLTSRLRDPGCNFSIEKSNREGHPINCLQWSLADEWCRGVKKALPTEEQWEFAAAGIVGRPFPWGAQPPTCLRAHFECQMSVMVTQTIEGGSLPMGATPREVHDLSGNVAEWTASDWRPRYDAAPDSTNKAVRGGGFNSTAPELRSAARRPAPLEHRNPLVGFRCVKIPD